MSYQPSDVFKERYNVNQTKTKETNVINVETSNKKKNPYNRTLDEVKGMVSKIMETLADSQSFEFYCKIAWSLPEHIIWNQLEKAQEKHKPAAYFSTVCKAIMAKQQ